MTVSTTASAQAISDDKQEFTAYVAQKFKSKIDAYKLEIDAPPYLEAGQFSH